MIISFKRLVLTVSIMSQSCFVLRVIRLISVTTIVSPSLTVLMSLISSGRVKACDEEYFTLLLRRYMMELSNRVAAKYGCEALITGESLGQVASQTMQALNVTNAMARYPVFRPCIGMDKDEIVQIARRIDTFDTSILPYEDCCTVFTPRHPKTRPVLALVEEQEQKLPFGELCDKAMETLQTVYIKAKF